MANMKISAGDRSQAQASPQRAAQYIRTATEPQQGSIDNQVVKICEYAAHRGIEIVRTYADRGKSGLSLDGRESLQQLIKDIETGAANFQVVLLYDVSRWGRFRDPNDVAYFENFCSRAGIKVAYCEDRVQDDNEGSPLSIVVKGIKRAIIAEYCRELAARGEVVPDSQPTEFHLKPL
jgi:DNA invertase Pin-like site-specific DNA recombinase